MKYHRPSLLIFLSTLLLSSPSLAEIATIREATASGPQANAQAGIQATVDAFRNDLGNPNNGNAVGSQTSGRRQVTWDGGDSSSAPAIMPGDFFNAVAPRGIIIRGENGRGQFQMSADGVGNNPTSTPEQFGHINATYPTAFSTFSSPRLFSGLNSNILEIDFVVSGTSDRATVSGFGAVFTDVDIANSSRIEFFDANGSLLLERSILASPGNESLSFLGVSFDKAELAHVRMTLGNGVLGINDITQGSTTDIVVVDDFIYGEPVIVAPPAPEITSPSSGTKTDSQFASFSGIAEKDSLVQIFDGSDLVGEGFASEFGTWKVDSQTIFSNGTHLISARATNSAGTSENSSVVEITFNVSNDMLVCPIVEEPDQPEDPVFDPTAIATLGKPLVTKSKKEVTLEMDSSDPAAAYFVRTTCRKNGTRKASSRIVFSNVTTFKRPKGKCKYSYSIVANGAESIQSPKGR
ncbi:MAG: hypothetical protein KDD64_04935 [Bdellovibrionales bacterium]|nr:hypothetical protein [Bdellovibrionales bacterium]